MKLNTSLALIAGIIIIVYGLLYVGSRQVVHTLVKKPEIVPVAKKAVPVGIEGFNSYGAVTVDTKETTVVDPASVQVPFTQEPVYNADDYEYNMVFKSESDRPLNKALRDKLMSQYPMDWSGRPPSSSQFQAGLKESFENAKPTVPDDAKPYENSSGNLMQPPDTSEVEREERKILQTYKPKFPPTPTSYDPRDAKELIDKIYDAKGLIPQVKHKEGTNVYEIVGTRKKDEKVVYEDEEGTVTRGPNPNSMESTIQAPNAVKDWNSPEKDSFFEEGQGAAQRTRMNKWDYTAWTPGLERMFAPTDPKPEWL